MSDREVRLLALERRAEARWRRRNALWHMACDLGRIERARRWFLLRNEADHLTTRLWLARVEAGSQRWAAK